MAPLPKMTQALDKEVCWLSVFQIACNTSTLLPGLYEKFAVWLLVCLPVTLEFVLPYELMLTTLRFEESTNANFFWVCFHSSTSIIQYHSTSLQLRYIFMFSFVQR
jgi:hypothetical protein